MTITSSLRFLYIFRGPGLLCGSIGWDWTGWKWIAKDRKNRTNYLYCNQNDYKKDLFFPRQNSALDQNNYHRVAKLLQTTSSASISYCAADGRLWAESEIPIFLRPNGYNCNLFHWIASLGRPNHLAES